MSKILIVDDEENIRKLIKTYAQAIGYEVEEAIDGREAISQFQKYNPDIIVMDVMMPEMDGFSALKEIRSLSDVPIIMLTARSEEYDKLHGLVSGADDYVTKPFSVKELLLRIEVILKRYHAKDKKIIPPYKYRGFEIDFMGRRVLINNKVTELTLKEYALLELLIKNINQVVERRTILESIWDGATDSAERSLDAHMKSLRKKLGVYSENIITLRKVGYRFEEK